MTYFGADDGQTIGSVSIDSTSVNNIHVLNISLPKILSTFSKVQLYPGDEP